MKKISLICLISILFILSIKTIVPHKYYMFCVIIYLIALIVISFFPSHKKTVINDKTVKSMFKKIISKAQGLRFESGNKIREEINSMFDVYYECSEKYGETVSENNELADKKILDALDALYDTIDLMAHKNFSDVKIIEDKCKRIKRLIKEKFNIQTDEN